MPDATEYQMIKLQQELLGLRYEVSRVKTGSSTLIVSTTLDGAAAATAANYGAFFTAPYSCQVIEAWASWATAGGSAPTLTIEKLDSGQATGAGVPVLSSTWNMGGTADDPIRVRATGVTEDRYLSPGDRLALVDSGTLTSVAHLTVTVLLRINNYQLSQIDNP